MQIVVVRALSAALGVMAALLPGVARAAHPLISDDTGVQGAGRWQLELNTDQQRARAAEGSQFVRQVNGTLTWGANDQLDLAINLPYGQQSGPGVATERGLGDIALQAKWRVYDHDAGWSLALKPVLTLPSGDSARGLGLGRATVGAFVLAQREGERWSWLTNLGYSWRPNGVGERRQIWSASSAALFKLNAAWTLALDLGASRAADPAGGVDKAALLGLIWHANERTDLDIGWRRSLGGTPAAHTLGLGLTLRW